MSWSSGQYMLTQRLLTAEIQGDPPQIFSSDRSHSASQYVAMYEGQASLIVIVKCHIVIERYNPLQQSSSRLLWCAAHLFPISFTLGLGEAMIDLRNAAGPVDDMISHNQRPTTTRIVNSPGSRTLSGN